MSGFLFSLVVGLPALAAAPVFTCEAPGGKISARLVMEDHQRIQINVREKGSSRRYECRLNLTLFDDQPTALVPSATLHFEPAGCDLKGAPFSLQDKLVLLLRYGPKTTARLVWREGEPFVNCAVKEFDYTRLRAQAGSKPQR